MREDTADYRRLFLENLPLLDVRSPVEFSKGAFPGAQNLPLLSDIERQKIGSCYKQHGQQAAIALGHELVNGRVRQERTNAWQTFVRRNPQGYLYCFRGGLRSRIVQQWLAEAGFHYPRVTGGYKAMRRFLIDNLEQAIAERPLTVVAGLTGAGKTEVIEALPHALDLERLANHRGSSFGGRTSAQPSQIDFENRLSIAALKMGARGSGELVAEDEGRLIGRCFLPPSLQSAIKRAPLVWLEDSLQNRIDRILRQYVVAMRQDYEAVYPHDPELAFDAYRDYLLGSLQRIRKRLGGERHARLLGMMQSALNRQLNEGVVDAHREWIRILLAEYYDPMYRYQRRDPVRIVFQGDQQEVVNWLQRRVIDA